jgi:CRISPR-associated endonuclease/helicase Cas3
MSRPSFIEFFKTATGQSCPYDYQCRLACGERNARLEPEWLAAGADCRSRLINIPTGLGKTAAVVVAWLWNRVHLQNPKWPRRLVYCLPMRTLVEQTRDEARRWIESVAGKNLIPGKPPRIIILMGGEELDGDARDWEIYPEENAILIGTQDMLLSRALNRGYGMSRYRWPMHFGLLNNDCLWILDETQLMGVGVRTSAQLEGLRQKIGVAAGAVTWWASATLDERLLDAPDHQEKIPFLTLEKADRHNTEVGKRINAVKRLSPLPLVLAADSSKAVELYIEKLASDVLGKHQPGSITIVILNRVNRAKELFSELGRRGKKEEIPECVLIHSRFRPMEREKLSAKIKESGEKIIIATQAIEAGVDISSRTLITELAPWSSLVQRFGRCNRNGGFNVNGGADVFWINLESDEEKNAANLALPYTPEQLAAARKLLRQAESSGVAPVALEEIEKSRPQEPLPETHILRRKDLVELFDTTPDLAGLDIDVGRYIRDGEERDVQVFWREIPEGEKPDEKIEPLRKELVRVSIGDFAKFLKANKNHIWHWNVLDGKWQRVERPSPNQVYLADRELGGYSETLGWTGEKSKTLFKILSIEDQPVRRSPRDGQGRDDESLTEFQSIEEHTGHVEKVCQKIIAALPSSAVWSKTLLQAAQWHDVGKAHDHFQKFLRCNRVVPPEFEGCLLAKTPWKSNNRHDENGRPYFRHELASALAWLHDTSWEDSFETNLVAYLIAAHHGKVRLSIRAMPGERVPEADNGKEVLFARGIWDGEELFAENSGKTLSLDGKSFKPIRLDLSCMKMGEQNGKPSWSARALSLRDHPQLGIFRIAWLETLLRAADAQGSML